MNESSDAPEADVMLASKQQRRPPRRLEFTDRGMRALVREASALEPAPGQRWTPRIEAWDASMEGFGARVSKTGAITWVIRYRRGTKQRVMTLGSVPQLSLAEARRRARRALGQADGGADPAAERERGREAASFGALAALYLEKHAVKKRSAAEDKRVLERELLPRWRTTALKDIRRADVIEFIEDVAAGKGRRRQPGRAAPVMANRILALLRKVFNFAIQRGLADANPCTLIPRPGSERPRERVLSEDEISGLWRGLDAEIAAGRPMASHLAAAVRLMLLTAQRRGEVLRMCWEHIGQEAGLAWWTIPGDHAKNGRAHRVPLSPEALSIVESLRAPDSTNPHVFPGRSGGYVANVESVIDRARACEGLAHFTPHDLRRTAASFMTSLGTARLVVKKVLNHVDRDVTAIYDRHSYDAEKRAALEAWARRLREIVTGERDRANVLSFARPSQS